MAKHLITHEAIVEPHTVDLIDIVSEFASPAVWTQLANNGTSAVTIQINADTRSHFRLYPGDTQVFNAGDLDVLSVRIINDNDQPQQVTVMFSV